MWLITGRRSPQQQPILAHVAIDALVIDNSLAHLVEFAVKQRINPFYVTRLPGNPQVRESVARAQALSALW